MVLGDPYTFAIIISTINSWNVDGTFCNGILFFCIDGEIFPKQVVSTTLSYAVLELKDNFMDIHSNEELYTIDKRVAFRKIFNMTYPESLDFDNDYRFNVTPYSFGDNNCIVFAVRNSDSVRIMAAEVDGAEDRSQHYFDSLSISEAFISTAELNRMMARICEETKGKGKAGFFRI